MASNNDCLSGIRSFLSVNSGSAWIRMKTSGGRRDENLI